jgi:hypothetical protein
MSRPKLPDAIGPLYLTLGQGRPLVCPAILTGAVPWALDGIG